jgi:hypothetical protein
MSQRQFPTYPLTRRTEVYFDRCQAADDAVNRTVGMVDFTTRQAIWTLVTERGCPPAKAVAIVTGVSVPMATRPRLVA